MPRGPLYTNLLKSAASPFNKHAISILVYYNASCIVILADQVFKKVVIKSAQSSSQISPTPVASSIAQRS